MPPESAADLSVALQVVERFTQYLLQQSGTIAAALHDGHRPEAQLQAIAERLASDRRDLERFSERIRQLRAQQRGYQDTR
jgi:hypothetical protein